MFGLHNLLPELRASMKGDFAPDAGEVPEVFVVAAKAPQVQNDAIHPGQFCCSIPTVASILHGFCPFVKFSVVLSFPFFHSPEYFKGYSLCKLIAPAREKSVTASGCADGHASPH